MRSVARVMSVSALVMAALVLERPVADAGQGPAVSAILTTPHFAFYSDFETNLNQALVADFVARRDGRPALFSSGTDKACFDALSTAAREGWSRAVDHYRTNQSSPGQRVLLRLELAGLVTREALPESPDRAVLEAFARSRVDAAPAYRECTWPARDAANRAWVATLEPLLRTYGPGLGEQLPKLFQRSGADCRFEWMSSIRLASRTAIRRATMPGGCTSWSRAPAPTIREWRRSRSCITTRVTSSRAKTRGVTLPRDVLHQVHFFMAGEAVRRSLDRAGQSYRWPLTSSRNSRRECSPARVRVVASRY